MDGTRKSADRIAQEAIALFREHGYNDTSVNEICKKAGVSRSTFYTSFSNKDEIIVFTLKNLKNEFPLDFAEFINVDNDFERMMFLFNYYIDQCEKYGPDLISALYKAEIDKSIGIIDSLFEFHDWFVRLIRNCQKNGVIRNKCMAEELVPLGVQIATAAVFEWCCRKGDFSLRDRTRRDMEIFYDVAPEYRVSKL